MGVVVVCKLYAKPEAVLLDPDEAYDIDPPQIFEGEIQDKGKTNFVGKAIPFIHFTWFLCRCISRWVQGLPITQLKIPTLAFVITKMVTYWALVE